MSFSQVIEKFDEFAGKNFDFGVEGNDFVQIADCKKIISEIFTNLNFGILNGSYTDIPTIQGFIQEAEIKIQDLLPSESLLFDEQNSNRITQEYLLSGFVKPLKYSLLHLKHLVSILENRLDSEEIQIFNKHSYKYPKPKSDIFDIGIQVALFKINCDVARYDHTISISDSYLHQLILLLDSIKTQFAGFDPFNEILEDKCKLLIFKVSKRLNKDHVNFTYQINLKKFGFNDVIESNYYFKNFIDEYERHYINNGSTQSLKQKRLDSAYLKRSRKEKLSLVDYHILIKHYKDDHQNLVQINNLIKQVEDRYLLEINTPETDLYLKRAWQIGINYFLNNKLSFLLRQDKISVEEVQNEVRNIETIQRETNVYNFFPFLKLCEYFNRKIKSENNKDEPNFEEVKKLLAIKAKYFGVLKKNLKWCQESDFQPFMAQKEDCIIPIKIKNDNKDIELYFSSGYILPLNYDVLLKDVETLEQSIDTYTLYQKMIEEKQAINEIKEEVVKHERKQIEILGIFAALVIFASSTIKLFQGLTDFEKAAKFSLVFSYSMSTFVILVWLISRDSIRKVSMVHWFIVSLIFIATITVFALSFSLWPFDK